MSEPKNLYIMLDASESYSKWFLDYIKDLEKTEHKSISHTTAFASLVATIQQHRKEIEERDIIISRLPEFKEALCKIVSEMIWNVGEGQKIFITPEVVEERINGIGDKK